MSRSVAEGWQDLLERGPRSEIELLRSSAFVSIAEASRLLCVDENAVVDRIHKRDIFALGTPDGGD
jgi:hypothetical protein